MKPRHPLLSCLITAVLAIATLPASIYAQGPLIIPNTGQQLTPTAPNDTDFVLLNPMLPSAPLDTGGQAVSSITSPDGKTLLVLTSGYNLYNYTSGPHRGKHENANSNEYVLVFDISKKKNPRQQQVIQVPNTYSGIAFDPGGSTFYVSGGLDDNLHIYDLKSGSWSERTGSPILLGHKAGVGVNVHPEAAGVAISADGSTIVIANYYDDSVSVLTKASGNWKRTAEIDLRPGNGVPGGEYPLWVAIKSTATAYVSSMRDREIDVVDLSAHSVVGRIHVKGQPNKMTLNVGQNCLFVAEDESDSVAIIDTTSNKLLRDIPVGAPEGLLAPAVATYNGHNTNSVTLSPDGKRLCLTNGNTNDVAVLDLNEGNDSGTLLGLIPTGWYPTSVSFSSDGTYMYVVNAKSITGPNPGNCHGDVVRDRSAAICNSTDQYNLQLIKGGLQSFPVPSASQLAELTEQVAANNHYRRNVSSNARATMAAIRQQIQHVIYIIKENRTYDQILGDLEVGNGDPNLTEFGQGTTPNLHALARNFVDLDNFYDRSEVSMDGWPWSTSARAPDVVEKQTWVNYRNNAVSYDSEGTNRNINIAIPTLQGRIAANPLTPNDPDVLPGTTDTSAPDGPDDEINGGYLWNQALRAGLSIRNYGFFIDLTRYDAPPPNNIKEDITPYADKYQVAYPANVALAPNTDIYFRGFDNAFPDYYRFKEWEREFDSMYARGGLPRLSFVRFMHDHTGNFSTALDSINTPELQQADNDYAVGLLVQKIAASNVYKENTLIFVIEDDSQDGGDHVDSHRSVAFIVGPYVKQHAVVSSAYNTVDFVRTIEEVLGLSPLNLNDAVAVPMADVFDLNQKIWSYTATPSTLLRSTQLPLQSTLFHGPDLKPTHDAQYWAEATKGMDFSVEDHFDFDQYNRILWKGLKGDQPYPDHTEAKK